MYACDLNPADPDLALSGGGDDRALLWRLSTGEVLFIFAGHTDSVSAVAFSSDGKLAAVGGMDGRVNVWDVATGELSASLEGPDEVVVRLWPLRIWWESWKLCLTTPERFIVRSHDAVAQVAPARQPCAGWKQRRHDLDVGLKGNTHERLHRSQLARECWRLYAGWYGRVGVCSAMGSSR